MNKKEDDDEAADIRRYWQNGRLTGILDIMELDDKLVLIDEVLRNKLKRLQHQQVHGNAQQAKITCYFQ